MKLNISPEIDKYFLSRLWLDDSYGFDEKGFAAYVNDFSDTPLYENVKKVCADFALENHLHNFLALKYIFDFWYNTHSLFKDQHKNHVSEMKDFSSLVRRTEEQYKEFMDNMSEIENHELKEIAAFSKGNSRSKKVVFKKSLPLLLNALREYKTTLSFTNVELDPILPPPPIYIAEFVLPLTDYIKDLTHHKRKTKIYVIAGNLIYCYGEQGLIGKVKTLQKQKTYDGNLDKLFADNLRALVKSLDNSLKKLS